VLATTVPEVFDGAKTGFPVAYVGVRLVLVALYARASRHVPEARALTRTFLAAFGAGILIWLASLAVPQPWNYVMWGAALVIEVLIPIPAWRLVRDAPIHPRHLPERFGLLTLIVLGESVLAVVLGVSRVSWVGGSAVAAAAGFLIAASVWWIYFDFLDEETIIARGVLSGLTSTYANYFVVVGLAALGAGVKLAIFAAGGEHRYDGTSWILSAGLAMTMLGLAVTQLFAGVVVFNADVLLRAATAGIALVLIPFGLSPLVVVIVLAAVLVTQVAYELARYEAHAA